MSLDEDIVGKRFGKWKVISLLPKEEWLGRHSRCRCVCTGCGSLGNVIVKSLRYGESRHCRNCRIKERREEIDREKLCYVGQCFGKLRIVRMAGRSECPPYAACCGTWWVCVCECGRERIQAFSRLSSGKCKECKECAKDKDYLRASGWPDAITPDAASVLNVIAAIGLPVTVKALSRLCGKPTYSVYHMVKQASRAGMVMVIGKGSRSSWMLSPAALDLLKERSKWEKETAKH